MTDKTSRTIQVKWVRSGIGFTRHQKEMVRSLGLGRLNQVVARPDTPQIRGLVARIPHLVEIVSEAIRPVWMSVPEYTILPPDPAAAPAKRPARVKPAQAEEVTAPAKGDEHKAKETKAEPEKTVAAAKPVAKGKKPAKAAAGKERAGKKAGTAKSAKPPKKTKK